MTEVDENPICGGKSSQAIRLHGIGNVGPNFEYKKKLQPMLR